MAALTKSLHERYHGESERPALVEELLDLAGRVVVGGGRLAQLAGEGEHVLVLHEDAGGPEAGRQLEHLLQVVHLGRGALQVEVDEALGQDGRFNQNLTYRVDQNRRVSVDKFDQEYYRVTL